MSLQEISSQIETAEERVGVSKGSTCLIAVSKVQPLDRVQAVLESGHRVFGENRVQEAQDRWGQLLPDFPDVELHLLGPLQSNKARVAMGLFGTIHSLDRIKLANALARLRDEGLTCPDLFIQVNTGDEPQKAGISVDDLPDFVAHCRSLSLPVVGLMCIPPVDEEPSLHFALLAKLAKQSGLEKLSMGMSADFETAIAQGATHVRVGSAIFGARAYG